MGLSRRRLIEVFTAETGMTPKRFSRVRRFQRALAAVRRVTSPRWPQVALATGYCDQSHLIRDFVAFAGCPPSVLHGHRKDPVKEHHLAIPDATEGQIPPIRRPPPAPWSVYLWLGIKRSDNLEIES